MYYTVYIYRYPFGEGFCCMYTEVCRLVEGQQFELITTLVHNRVSRLLRSTVLWSIMFA